MRLAEARGFVMQALREGRCGQAVYVFMAVGDYKARVQGIDRTRTLVADGRQFLDSGDHELILEVIWGFIIQGILVPGLNDANQSWPFLRLTEYGRRCVKEERVLPHDPDGYLTEFHRAIPDDDPVVAEYLTESLQCYLRGLNRAAAVMLGAASEAVVLRLIDGFADAISDFTKKQRFASDLDKAQSVFRRYELFDRSFSPVKSKLPRNLIENLDAQVRGVFDLIRNSRNEAGHPATDVTVDGDVVYSHLRLFIPYCARIYELIGWFSANPV